jgi:hypothetical protein
MDQHQQDLRRAAAQAFMESLDQLQETLCPAEAETAECSEDDIPTVIEFMELPLSDEDDALDFEQAVADIDRFMQSQQGDPPIQPNR